MTVIFKSKIPPWAEVFPQIENIIANQKDTPFCVGIPYGLQLQKHIWNPERLRIVIHLNTATGHSFISHHGVGKKNEINIWNFSKEKQPGNSTNSGFTTISTELKFLHILFAQRRWIYVTFCTDLSMKIFSAKFHILSTTSVNKTVLSLAYNEMRDEIITGIAGGIMTWKFPIGQTDPLIPGQLISCSFTPFDWVMSIALDNTSRQILAISDVRISMIDLQTHRERCFFQKKCDFSFTTCVFYNPASYFITGDKNGSIRAWSTSVNSFPLVTQFLGHTAEITKLLVHAEEPLLVSSSLDKTIRVWNLDTCALTFKLETGEEIIEMDLLSGDLLYYHSHHHLKIWSLNLFHSLFTALSSRILRWTRVKSPGCPPRVLVHAEDGGVRLVSPVHGYELTTVLPITTMTTDIIDVAHDPRQEKIYLVLGTREVLVFESDTNPCCAYQLWVPENPDEGVCSLAMINAEFALHENEITLKSGLLFAGHFNGQISLVSGKDVYMKENVQAHQGQVTFLRVSAACTESHDSLASRDHLVSCGTDCTVRIWQLIHPEINRVSIQQVALVKLLKSPRDLAMAGNTLCMAMADNNVIMCRVRDERKDKDSVFHTKKSHEFLTHSKDERHTAPINGLSSCSTLGLFATSSEDHCVKIWNTDNQLVREMCFDESLCGVCFANSRGDILVGFQSHISLVTILNYLPLPYLEMLSKMHFDNDPFEDHVQFNDLLKFWYDPERVPRMPLEASKRRPLEPPEIKRPKKRKKVHVMMALRRLSTKSSSKTMNISQIIKAAKKNADQPTAKTDSQHMQIPTSLDSEKDTTEVYWPCAPDGYIPNSVVRGFIKPRRPPARLIPRMKRPEVTKEETIEEEEDDEDQHRITDFWTLWTTMQKAHVKTKLREASSKKKDHGGTKSRRRRVPEKASSKLGRRLAPRPQAGEQFSEAPLMELEEFEGEEEIEEEEEEEPEEIDEILEEEEHLDEQEASEESPESSPELSVTKESPEMNLEESDEEEEEEDESIEDVDESPSFSSESESPTSVMKLEITPAETPLLVRIQRKEWYPKLEQRRQSPAKVEDVLENMLKALSNEKRLENIQDICEQFINIRREFGIPDERMVEIQNGFIKLTYNEKPKVRQAAVWALGELDVHREDAYLTVVRRLIDDHKDTREEAKRVLKKLTGVDTKEGLCNLMIKSGVVHLYLPSSDNAVLHELADRLRNAKWKKSANQTELVEGDDNLDNLRATMRRKPFKAKFRHPKTMGRTRAPRTRRRPSILDEAASLSNTEKLKNKMKESTLGCKLLQQMEPFRSDISGSPEIEGKAEHDWCKEDEKMRQVPDLELKKTPIVPSVSITKAKLDKVRIMISPEGGTSKSLKTTHARMKDSVLSKESPPKERSKQSTPQSRDISPRWNRRYDVKAPPVSPSRHPELLSLTQILKVMDCAMGLNQPSAMLLLLKMKRTKRIIPKQVAQEDGTIQQFYTVGDLLEVLCQMPPLADFVASLAQKASKSKEEILMNMRGLFRSESLHTLQRGNHVVVNGFGRLPLKYLETLLDLRRKVFENIYECLGNLESLSPSRVSEVSKSFTSLLKSVLWFCAILQPDIEVDDHFASQRSQLYTTLSQIQGMDVARWKMDEQPRPIFEQPSLYRCLRPGNDGQRLLNSTLIRAKALSDSRLRSAKETKDFIVTSLPHRLSVHTGKRIKGESHFGIMELTWRAGTPLPPANSETSNNTNTNNFAELSGKPVELKEQYVLNKERQSSQTKIPKSKSVPPLSHRKVKPFAEKRLDMFRAVNSLYNKDSLTALSEYIDNRNIINKNYLDKNGNFIPGSFTDFPPPPNTATPISFQASPALHSLNNDSMTSVKSGDSSVRCSSLYDLPRDMTRDTLLNELNKFHLPPIWK
ncbi:hypothetical protein ACROYT_G007121 [Oculina patagonica]